MVVKRLLLTFLPAIMLACAGLPSEAAQAPAKDRMVVVVSLDGFPAFALDDPALPIPTLRRLMREGASARRMTSSNPSVTWPSHTSMATRSTETTPATRSSICLPAPLPAITARLLNLTMTGVDGRALTELID